MSLAARCVILNWTFQAFGVQLYLQMTSKGETMAPNLPAR